MTIEEIRKGAPDGAQKFFICDDGELIYFKFDGFDVFQFMGGSWGWVDNIEGCPSYYSELKPLQGE